MAIIILKGNGKVATDTYSSQYYGDKISGELDSWDTIANDPNRFIRDSYGILSDRNATLYQTEPMARACINKPLSYAIGDGVVLKSAINADYIGWSKAKANAWSRKFSTLLHLEKMAASWYDKQAILFREASICGDSLLYFIREKDSELPFELVTAGGHAIDWQKSLDRETGRNWNLGIELDKYGRRKAFWQSTTDSPMDFKDKFGNIQAIQFMFQELSGQARGYGMVHSVIALMKKMGKVWDATVARMVLESIMLGYYNVDHTDPAAQMRNFADRAKGKITPTSTTESTSTLERANNVVPGTMMQLQNKESMTFTDLKTPSDNFGLANEWFLKMIAMGRSYPPEFILGEYSTSYTAHKGALNDAIKKFMQERTTYTRNVEKYVNLEYLKHFALTGQIEVPPGFWTDYKIREAMLMGSYLGPVPGHINPLQEVKADEAATKNAFTDHESTSRKYGHDFYEFFDGWAEQQDMWASASPEYKAETLAAEQAKATAEAASQDTGGDSQQGGSDADKDD
jgi:hypothetical protein